MASFLSRIGALESRLSTQTLWSSGKRKRGDWVCAECRARRAFRQRRAYSDDNPRIAPEEYLFPLRDPRNEEVPEKWPTRRSLVDTKRDTRLPWGLRSESSETSHREAQDGPHDREEQIENEHWESFERVEEEVEEPVATETVSDDPDSVQHGWTHSSLLDFDYASSLPHALTNNEPDMVARCLYAAEARNDLEFIRSIPSPTFAECIRLLQPSNFTANLASAHVEISEAMAKQLGLTQIDQVAWRHSKVLQAILAIRQAAGVRIGLPEHKILLRSARDLGRAATADKFWRSLLNDGLTPDTECYNYMMAALIWDGTHQAVSRHRVRAIPFHLLARQNKRLGVEFANYRVGSGGLKAQVTRIFGDMLKDGAIADEESFRNIITGAAREGDMSTVKSVLRRVWNVDVDELIAGKDEAKMAPRQFHDNSPLRPTSKLLFTLAHAFGINNEIPNALRVVDFVARQYNIHIDFEIWSQLFEWTFVLAAPRSGIKSRTDGSKAGQLPQQSVLSLWETMTGPPYFVQPTMGMYNHLIKNLQNRDSTPMMYEKMCEGLGLYRSSIGDAHRAFRQLQRALSRNVHESANSLETLRREWEHLDLIRQRNLFWCKRWLRLLLGSLRSWNRIDLQMEWALREIPRILLEWRTFAPTVVRYDTVGGVVEFEIRTQDEIESNRKIRMAIAEEQEKVLKEVPLFVAEEWVRPRSRLTMFDRGVGVRQS